MIKMNFINKFKKIHNLSELREKQLDTYEVIYKDIEQYSEECPKEIIHFMINQHRLNRLTSKKLYSDSLINFFYNVDNNLRDIDNSIGMIKQTLKSTHFCKELKNFINYQNNLIKNME
tara:strand:- start:568 stop:921 length:354 start_codon:yes stop_codon:yes gene_type:complete